MKMENDLGQDSIWKLVLRLALPAMAAQFINVLYSIVDRIYIGNIPGKGSLALAGAGICGPIVTLLSSFGTLVGLGGSILMAMRMGEGKLEKARQILANCFFLLILFSAILTVLFLLSKDTLLFWFGASEATFPYADTYLTIYTGGTFFALMAMGLNYFITCQGFARIGMFTVVLGALANLILDPIFIFVFDLGVAGAAIATVLSQLLSCIIAVSFLFGKRAPVTISFGNYNRRLMTQILSVGLPPFLILATDSLILIILNTVLSKTGGNEADLLITAVTIVQSYMAMITGPMLGISSGTQAIISYNYGACQLDRVRQAEKKILLLCLAFTAFMFLVSRLLPEFFVRLFTRDAAAVSVSVWGIHTFTLGIIPLSFQYVLVDGLTAMGRTKTALILSILRKGTYITAAVVLAVLVSARSSFYAEPLSDLFSAAVSTTVFLLVFEKHLEKRKKERIPDAG